MKVIFILSCIIIFFFGVLGSMFFGTIIHEYSHMKDYHGTNVSLSNETITINIPLEWKDIWKTDGVYSVRMKQKDMDYVHEEIKYTELKAYAISTSITLLFVLSFMYIVCRKLITT